MREIALWIAVLMTSCHGNESLGPDTFSLAQNAVVRQAITDGSFTNTSSIPNRQALGWTPAPDGEWADTNDVHYPGTLLHGGGCRGGSGNCVTLTANATDAAGTSCPLTNDTPGCNESIRQNFAAIDSRRLQKIAFHGRRHDPSMTTGWGVIVALLANTSDTSACNGRTGSTVCSGAQPCLDLIATDGYVELTRTGPVLTTFSNNCFDQSGSYAIRGLALTKAGTAGATMYVDDVSLEWLAPAGLEPPLAALVPEAQEPPLPERAFALGSTLPLKFRDAVLDAIGGSAPRLVSLTRVDDPAPLEVVPTPSGEANDDGLFRYSDEDGLWIYNLATAGLEAGTYRAVIGVLSDSDRYVAGFVLR